MHIKIFKYMHFNSENVLYCIITNLAKPIAPHKST